MRPHYYKVNVEFTEIWRVLFRLYRRFRNVRTYVCNRIDKSPENEQLSLATERNDYQIVGDEYCNNRIEYEYEDRNIIIRSSDRYNIIIRSLVMTNLTV